MYFKVATASLLLMISVLPGCRSEPLNQPAAPDPNDASKPTSIQQDFERMGHVAKLTTADEYLIIESNGLPDHKPMIGIDWANDLVPLPQQYTGDNAWKIPLKPRKSLKPVHVTKSLYRGVIALAVNGVPIVNPLNEQLVHSFNPNELDEFGGHCGCGRGDEYHYHLAPIHLQSVVGKGKPIAYALDGYPIYGFYDQSGKEPTDLDEYHGRVEEGQYRYYSSREFPYVNAGLRGAVEIRNGQVFPQPSRWPVRFDGLSSKIRITSWNFDSATQTYLMTYKGGNYRSIQYALKSADTVEFSAEGYYSSQNKVSTLSRSSPDETFPQGNRSPRSHAIMLRIPNGFSGNVFFIKDSSAPAMKPKYGRLRIDVPKDGVIRIPDLQILGNDDNVFAEYFDGTLLSSYSGRSLVGSHWEGTERVRDTQFAELKDGGSGSKQNAEGKMITWRAFRIKKSGEEEGALPGFPPGL